MNRIKVYLKKIINESKYWKYHPLIIAFHIVLFSLILSSDIHLKQYYHLTVFEINFLPFIHGAIMGILLHRINEKLREKRVSINQLNAITAVFALRLFSKLPMFQNKTDSLFNTDKFTEKIMKHSEVIKTISVEGLKELLKTAIDNDDFETAIKVRDELKIRKNG